MMNERGVDGDADAPAENAENAPGDVRPPIRGEVHESKDALHMKVNSPPWRCLLPLLP
jgi:hypothetical protein